MISEGGSNFLLEQLSGDELLLDVKRPGSAIVRVRWTPYWFARGACVERHGNWTRVTATRTGFVRLSTRFLARARGIARPPLRSLNEHAKGG